MPYIKKRIILFHLRSESNRQKIVSSSTLQFVTTLEYGLDHRCGKETPSPVNQHQI